MIKLNKYKYTVYINNEFYNNNLLLLNCYYYCLLIKLVLYQIL